MLLDHRSWPAPLFLYASDLWNRCIRKADNPWLFVFSAKPT